MGLVPKLKRPSECHHARFASRVEEACLTSLQHPPLRHSVTKTDVAEPSWLKSISLLIRHRATMAPKVTMGRPANGRSQTSHAPMRRPANRSPQNIRTTSILKRPAAVSRPVFGVAAFRPEWYGRSGAFRRGVVSPFLTETFSTFLNLEPDSS